MKEGDSSFPVGMPALEKRDLDRQLGGAFDQRGQDQHPVRPAFQPDTTPTIMGASRRCWLLGRAP
jgi:hypothetical protein